MYMYVYVCICMYMYVYVCMCMYTSTIYIILYMRVSILAKCVRLLHSVCSFVSFCEFLCGCLALRFGEFSAPLSRISIVEGCLNVGNAGQRRAT